VQLPLSETLYGQRYLFSFTLFFYVSDDDGKAV